MEVLQARVQKILRPGYEGKHDPGRIQRMGRARASERDFTIESLLHARSEDERAELTERLRQELNVK